MGFSIAKVFRSVEKEIRKYTEVDHLYLPAAGAKPWQLCKNIKAVKRKIQSNTYDIIHITGSEHYLIPFLNKSKYKVVVTVHDLGFFTNSHLSLRTFFLYLLWIKPLNKAHCVTCISAKTRQEVERLVRFDSKQICTIANPVGNEFIRSEKDFNIYCPTILHIGTKPNKNLNNTILALRNIPHHLRIIGHLSNEQKSMLEIYQINYSNAFDLTDDEMVKEYQQCDIVNFPSFYEGFGMPIIEGQAIGRVIVTSNLSPMKEVAGDGAILVNPSDPDSIRISYLKAKKDYKQLINAGYANVEHFRLKEIAQQYFNLYLTLYNK